MQIAWKKVWKNFDSWCKQEEKKQGNIPSWASQRKQIAQLVENEIRRQNSCQQSNSPIAIEPVVGVATISENGEPVSVYMSTRSDGTHLLSIYPHVQGTALHAELTEAEVNKLIAI